MKLRVSENRLGREVGSECEDRNEGEAEVENKRETTSHSVSVKVLARRMKARLRANADPLLFHLTLRTGS